MKFHAKSHRLSRAPLLLATSLGALLATLLATLLAAPLTANATEAPGVAPGDTLLTVSAEGRSARKPDIATFSAGVATTGKTAGEAMSANAAAMNRVIEALRHAGIEPRDIQTNSLSLTPVYAQRKPGFNDEAAPLITGYRASNNVSVRERRLADTGKVIDALVAAGANEVSGPDFAVDNSDAALDEARRAALTSARARAELYARAAGLKVSRILSISETGGYQPRPMLAMAKVAMAAPTSVEAGEVDLVANVTVQFELAP